jgi:L-malate glycosyltransferase
MKVCFVAGTLGRGGAEKQLLYFVRALLEIGVAVRVLCLTKDEVYESKIKDLNVPVDWIGESPNRFIRLKNVTDNLRANPPDIVQSSHFYTNIYAGLAGRLLRIPSIGAIRSDLESEIKLHGLLGRWQIRLPRFLIANSLSAYRRAMQSYHLDKKVALVQNVVERGNCERDYRRTSTSETKFLWVGRLDENKKPERFIHLAAELRQLFPDYPLRFSIAGDGNRRDEMERLSRSLDLSPDEMCFLGDCANMSELYRQSDILVSTSDREGTPNVILEAMAHGLPVIATNVGGTPDILNSECGILVSPGCEEQLLQASAKLLKEPQLRHQLGIGGRRYTLANHSFENLKKSLPLIYNSLLEKSAR